MTKLCDVIYEFSLTQFYPLNMFNNFEIFNYKQRKTRALNKLTVSSNLVLECLNMEGRSTRKFNKSVFLARKPHKPVMLGSIPEELNPFA